MDNIGGAGDIIDPDDETANLTFYYSREKRLERAPQKIRDYYANPDIFKKPGFFRVLVKTRANRMLFTSIIALCILGTILSKMTPGANTGTIDGVTAKLSAFSFDSTIYVSISLSADKSAKNRALPRAGIRFFSAEVVCLNKDGEERDVKKVEGFLEISSGGEAFLRTTFDNYDIIKVGARITDGSEVVELTASVVRQ